MKFFVYAYTAFNLGDDLFLHVLARRYPSSTFLIAAPKKYQAKFKQLTNVRIIPNDSFRFRLINKLASLFFRPRFLEQRHAKKCDGIIYIGGSLFMQTANWKRTYKQIEAMIMKGKPFYLLGANFGPFEDKLFFQTYEKLFRSCTDICFRDEASYERFNHLPQVRRAADVVFQLEKRPVKTVPKTVVISVIKPSIREHLAGLDQLYYMKLAEITEYLTHKGYTVILMSFCAEEQDDVAVKQIKNILNEEVTRLVKTFFYDGNIDAALEVFTEATHVIATRFHAMILAWINEKPVFPVVYSDKMRTVMKDLQFDGPYARIRDINRLQPETVLEMGKLKKDTLESARKSAEKQFEQLDRMTGLNE